MSAKGTATYLGHPGPQASAASGLYRLDPPMTIDVSDDSDQPDEQIVKYIEYVVVTTFDVFGDLEVHIFESDKDGQVLSWIELDKVLTSNKDHANALRYEGYEIVRPQLSEKG